MAKKMLLQQITKRYSVDMSDDCDYEITEVDLKEGAALPEGVLIDHIQTIESIKTFTFDDGPLVKALLEIHAPTLERKPKYLH